MTAKWHPAEARRPDVKEAPVFYPSEEVIISPQCFIYPHHPIPEIAAIHILSVDLIFLSELGFSFLAF